MHIDTLRFGEIDIDDSKVIEFDNGIPGLEEYHRYSLLQYEDSYPIIWLQSVEDGGICLPVMDTFAVLSGYVFDIDDTDVKELNLSGPEDLHVVSVLVIPEDITNMTANLAAPIVINTVTGRARQVLLSGGEYNIRAPIFQDIYMLVKGEEGEADAGAVKKA